MIGPITTSETVNVKVPLDRDKLIRNNDVHEQSADLLCISALLLLS